MDKENFVQCIFTFLGLMAIAISIACTIQINAHEKDAIKHGAAEYNKITGEFQWKDTLNTQSH